VGGVLELRLGEPFVVVDRAVPDELHLRHAGDGLQIGMQDGLSRALCFVVAVAIILGCRIERLNP
jgi:hypothetical protein